MTNDPYEREWLPKRGEYFNAFSRPGNIYAPPHHPHCMNPMLCSYVGHLRGKRAVETRDCRFYLDEWYFQPG